VKVWNVMFGLGVVVETCGACVVLGRGTVRLLQASVGEDEEKSDVDRVWRFFDVSVSSR
jgi:hypothetical protein